MIKKFALWMVESGNNRQLATDFTEKFHLGEILTAPLAVVSLHSTRFRTFAQRMNSKISV